MIYKISIVLTIIYLFFIFSFKKNNKCKVSYLYPGITVNGDDYISEFKKNNIVFIRDIFDSTYFYKLKNEVLKNSGKSKRQSFFELFRKASSIKAEDISKSISDLYYSVHFLNFLKNVSGLELENVNCDDESSMNIFVYDKPGDFISWHNDPNHYNGNRLTILINIVNKNSNNSDLSDSELQYIIDGKQESIKMPPNSIVIFNGSKIKHRATSIKQGEIRTILSFTYCDLCEENFMGYIVKNIKNIVLGY